KDEKEVWSYRLSEFFISQNEVLDTIFKTKGLLFDVGFLRKAIFDNNFRREYSIVKLVIHILRNFLLRLSNIYRKIMES
ncbi:MAG: hypothetical protein ACW98X_26735, partial [Promethearchaeota archaeon]